MSMAATPLPLPDNGRSMHMKHLPVDEALVAEHNRELIGSLEQDYATLGEQLQRRNVDIDDVCSRAMTFDVAIPTWGVGTGGTRFARFPEPGEPRNFMEKLEDCAVIQQLGRATPALSPHFPWDATEDWSAVLEYTGQTGMHFDAVNSNTFQDFPDQKLSYKFGSLTHQDKAVRDQAIQHNLECIQTGIRIGSKAITVWIADGTNFAGQQDFTASFERYLESMKEIYAALPEDWQIFIEHKIYEPALYSTVIQDWGSSYLAATELGDKARCLVDLGHHAPTTNIEMIVARLIQFRKLAGFHFNDSKYGDDDLDTGSIAPFQLFLVFNELVSAEDRKADGFSPAYMLDQSHNITDPIESLIMSAAAVRKSYIQACLVDREELAEHQKNNDPMMAHQVLVRSFQTDVSAIVAMARYRAGGAIAPVDAYRRSGYRSRKAKERPQEFTGASGIV